MTELPASLPGRPLYVNIAGGKLYISAHDAFHLKKQREFRRLIRAAHPDRNHCSWPQVAPANSSRPVHDGKRRRRGGMPASVWSRRQEALEMQSVTWKPIACCLYRIHTTPRQVQQLMYAGGTDAEKPAHRRRANVLVQLEAG